MCWIVSTTGREVFWLYYGFRQEKSLQWKRTQAILKEQSVEMGEQYDAPESVDLILPFIESFHLQDRYACSAQGARSEEVFQASTNSLLTVFPTIDLAQKFWIKGFGFSLEGLLGSKELAQDFDGGSINIARLATQDYHRWHAPTSGTVDSITDIPGTYYTVNPQAINEPGTLDVFCENKRSVMMLKRAATGSRVALIAVGAMLVGSIRYNPGIQQGAEVTGGQCLGAFLYGGSTVIVLYPENEVELDQDLVKNSTESVCETLVRVGERVEAEYGCGSGSGGW
ncbi:uncharacterized protein MYCFIDRAFT_186418 [Pseudocercospora fijiensis CIRAD86]|uniref:Phosphatidylserine decarboxylase n=1 Tax=Pseudocercospora fijiensis (strain CIRAD86) TaxID=383855 RepID=M3AN66_PSEFD|nr:uncharacterized protein MYCFIDRAFT_186418 [Pseudocercospora fijiensis CIRAD86]EME86046.1 hypothetical protein MYCFIDRAFT_186418 [Pseudocercospora fijiensis CIRAD86]